MLKEAKVYLTLNNTELSGCRVDNSDDAVDVLSNYMKDLDREMVIVMPIRTNNVPMFYNVVCVGGLAFCHAYMPNIFKVVLLSGCEKFILFHNHPSGCLEPSKEDWELTKKLYKGSEILDLKFVDHIIVGGYSGDHVSLRALDPTFFKKDHIQYKN